MGNRFCTFASGSSGNAALFSDGMTHILIDAGISCRRITQCLAEMGITPRDVSAVVLTHGHGDHVCGMGTLAKRLPVPVYCTAATTNALTNLARTRCVPVTPDEPFTVGGIEVLPFATPHDVPGSVGYFFRAGGFAAAVATDLGHVPPSLPSLLAQADLLMIEANHDPERLRTGPYPRFLKRRIAGDYGHLSNEACAELVGIALAGRVRRVVLAHLSEENNRPELAYRTVEAVVAAEGFAAGQEYELYVAPAEGMLMV
jgi:phosphoribosyl 1,2-cyclic phosphodiesterase